MWASRDEDSDGQNNLAEYIAGLDPKNATSLFQIETLDTEDDPQGMMTVQFSRAGIFSGLRGGFLFIFPLGNIYS